MAGLSIRSDVRELNPAKPRSNHRGSKFYLQISDFLTAMRIRVDPYVSLQVLSHTQRI
jgi:hypothetical protein